jgi:hypothetical protein
MPCQVRAAKRERAHVAEAWMLVFKVATPSSTQPTVSTLTAEGGGGGREEREDSVEEEGGEEGREEGKQVPSLKSIFDCSYIKPKTVNDGKDGWECGWCGKIFAPRHASRALQHVLKIKKGNIAVCKAAFPDRFQKRYQALYDSGKGRMDSKKRSSKCIYESMALQQESAVGNLLQKCGVMVSGSAFPSSSVSNFSSALAGTSTSTSVRESRAPPFAFSSLRLMVSTMNTHIWKSNNATVEMVIADFFHCENIPDSVVELPRFIRLVRVCRLVGEDFVMLHQKKIGS